MSTDSNETQTKNISGKLLIGILLISIIIIVIYMNFTSKQKQHDEEQKNKMLLAVAYDYFQKDQNNKELIQLIGDFKAILIKDITSKGEIAEIDINKFSALSEEGKKIIEQKGMNYLTDSLNNDFLELVNLIKSNDMYSDRISYIVRKIELSNAIGLTDFKDIGVLNSYVASEKYHKQGDDLLMASFLDDIPDNYNGYLSKDILSRKKELASTSKTYDALKVLNEISLIKFEDCEWYTRGNYAYFEGKIRNSLSFPISYVKVEVVYKDNNGKVIDTDWTYAVDSHPLQPNYSKSFSLMTPFSPGMTTASCSVISYTPNK